jgi:ParB family chromosome partitioning protein
MNDRKPERRGLGRGLSALMADAYLTPEEPNAPPRRAETHVPIEFIEPNPDQPRRTFDADRLEELAASIREKGVIQPLIVRRHPRKESHYEIVAGERRWRAAQIAQQHELPVIIRDLSDTCRARMEAKLAELDGKLGHRPAA